MADQEKTDKSNKPNFEEALKRLEKITEQIEQGEVGLEESIAKYEEGMKLVTRCRDMLAKAEQRIQKLSPTPAGELKATDDNELAKS